MRVFLLGAGASAATLGCHRAPISANFGATLQAQNPAWPEQYPFLQAATAYLQNQSHVGENWRLDEVWNGIDENYKLRRIIGNAHFPWPAHIPNGKRLYAQYAYPSWESFWVLAGWELKRTLADIYGARLQPHLEHVGLPNKWLAQQIQQLHQDDVLATTNYDLLAEGVARITWPHATNCLAAAEFRARPPDQGPLILKLHGSLDWLFRSNWITNQNRVDRTPGGAPIADVDIDLDQNFWETRPLVVAPVRYKDEIVFPNAQPADLVEVLNFQWETFLNVVARADELQVFGYRFPSEDSYGNRMLQEAVRRRQAGHQLPVRLYLLNDECQEVRARLRREIFRAPGAQVECAGPIPAGDLD